MQTPTGEMIEGSARGSLSAGEAAEFARQVAGLAAAGLPLGSGLRALADELARGRLPRMLRDVADRVEAGETLESALSAEGTRFPAPLRGLIAAGVRSGRLAEALGRFLELDDLGKALRGRLLVALIYPSVMFATSFCQFVFVAMIATGFEGIFADFGIAIPWITTLLLTACRRFANAGWWVLLAPFGGVGVIWLAMRLTLGAADRRRLLHALPLIGPLARDAALAQFCPVLALMLESEVPLGEALALTAEASSDAAMSEAIRKIAIDVESGLSLAEAVKDRKPFPPGFDRFLGWAEGHRGLVDALRLSAETFETRARARAAFVARFCNVVTMAVVLWWVGLAVVALFLPLLNLMSALGGSGPGSGDWIDSGKVAGVAALTILGVGSVLVLVWPTLYRVASIASLGRTGTAPAPSENRFWYLAAMGWTLIGSMAVMLSSNWLLRWLARDWMPEWWTGEIGPLFDVLGVAIAGAGLILVIFSALSSRWARHRAGVKAASLPTTDYPRVRVRPWEVRFGLRHMMFAMAPIALMMVLAREFGWSALAVMALLTPPLVVVIAFLAFTDRRSLQREVLLQVMAMAAREHRPLGPAISAFSATCRGAYRRKVSNLAHCLERGDPLPRALSAVPGVLTRTGETVARVGWETGTLSRMLDDAVAASAAEKAAKVVALGSIAYPLGVMAIILGIGTFLMAFATTRFAAIFRDFQVEMPEPTRTFFAATNWLLGRLGGGGMGLLEAIILGALVGASAAIAIGLGIFVGRRLLDRMPLVDRVAMRRHTAVILRALAAAVEAGQTMPAVLGRLGASYPRDWVRKRLRWAAERVDRGEAWASAMRIAGLMSRSDAVLLGAAERVGNLPWALRETAGSGERRLIYRLLAIGQVTRTLLIVAMGGLVLLFAVLYFRPLITLIDAMAGRI